LGRAGAAGDSTRTGNSIGRLVSDATGGVGAGAPALATTHEIGAVLAAAGRLGAGRSNAIGATRPMSATEMIKAVRGYRSPAPAAGSSIGRAEGQRWTTTGVLSSHASGAEGPGADGSGDRQTNVRVV
jgi:hypothetical protein